MDAKTRQDIDDLQLTQTVIGDLESLLDGLRQTVENGALVVSYGVREDTKREKVLTLWSADGTAEEYLYPEVLERLLFWLDELPEEPPKED